MPWLDLGAEGFVDGAPFPAPFFDASPAVTWSDPGPHVDSYVVVVEDLDSQPPLVHWCVFDIPATERSLEAALGSALTTRGGGKQATNDLGVVGYSGPARSSAPGRRFALRIYAIEGQSGLSAGAPASEVLRAVSRRVTQFASLVVLYDETRRRAVA